MRVEAGGERFHVCFLGVVLVIAVHSNLAKSLIVSNIFFFQIGLVRFAYNQLYQYGRDHSGGAHNATALWETIRMAVRTTTGRSLVQTKEPR